MKRYLKPEEGNPELSRRGDQHLRSVVEDSMSRVEVTRRQHASDKCLGLGMIRNEAGFPSLGDPMPWPGDKYCARASRYIAASARTARAGKAPITGEKGDAPKVAQHGLRIV